MTIVVPFFRVGNADTAAIWYRQLGFEERFRHRFADGLPLFVSVGREDAEIFLSEHVGDAPPSSLAYVRLSDATNVRSIAAQLGVDAEMAEYGLVEVEVIDPDGNRLRIGAPETS